MQVVLLSAGLGSRLGSLTKDIPKALVEVGGQPLFAHALTFARALAPSGVVVVGGFGFPLLREALSAYVARTPGLPPVELVENVAFRDGNLVSFEAARRHVREDFVLLNVDHIFRPTIAPLVAAPADEVTAFIDTDRTLGADDMKVERDERGHVRRIAKTLTSWDAGYVGMTRVPARAHARYFAEIDRALAEEGRAIHVERILARLATSDAPPACRDISGHGWLEVDTPDERERAEQAFAGPGWARP